MKEVQNIIRLSIFSKEDSSLNYFDEIEKMLPKANESYRKGEKKILSDGRVFPKLQEETSFDFKLKTEGLDLEKNHEEWISLWSKYFDNLKIIKNKFNFDLHLNYEITVSENHYPSMYFPVSFTSILSDLDIELSIYIYNE